MNFDEGMYGLDWFEGALVRPGRVLADLARVLHPEIAQVGGWVGGWVAGWLGGWVGSTGQGRAGQHRAAQGRAALKCRSRSWLWPAAAWLRACQPPLRPAYQSWVAPASLLSRSHSTLSCFPVC